MPGRIVAKRPFFEGGLCQGRVYGKGKCLCWTLVERLSSICWFSSNGKTSQKDLRGIFSGRDEMTLIQTPRRRRRLLRCDRKHEIKHTWNLFLKSYVTKTERESIQSLWLTDRQRSAHRRTCRKKICWPRLSHDPTATWSNHKHNLRLSSCLLQKISLYSHTLTGTHSHKHTHTPAGS